MASSHREAPFITRIPRSTPPTSTCSAATKPAARGYVTLIANYLPLQDAYGGPNYFAMDPNALYEIHIDNNGDAKEDLTFQFRFKNTNKDTELHRRRQAGVDPAGDQRRRRSPASSRPAPTCARPTRSTSCAATAAAAHGGRDQRRRRRRAPSTSRSTTSATRRSPTTRPTPPSTSTASTSPAAPTPAACSSASARTRSSSTSARSSTWSTSRRPPPSSGRRREGRQGRPGRQERHRDRARGADRLPEPAGGDPVIGGWTTASLRQGRLLNPTPEVEPSRLERRRRLDPGVAPGHAAGQRSGDRPEGQGHVQRQRAADDGQFADYVTNPTLPALLEILFGSAGVKAPTNFPRTDLVAAFLTGVQGLNKPAHGARRRKCCA